MPKMLPTPREVFDALFKDPDERLAEIITRLPFDVVVDVRTFVRSARDLRRLSKACEPEVVREAVLLAKRERVAVEAVREAWLRRKVVSDEVAREAIDFIHRTADEAIEEACRNLEECLKKPR